MKKNIYFVTGNEDKARYLSDFLGIKILHQKVDLDEIQSMSLQEIVQKKVKQAYEIIQEPVLVEDVSLEFKALGGLPGPFIKFFVDNMELTDICKLLPANNRRATARCIFGYFDGQREKYFEGKLSGEVAKEPRGKGGYGWDQIFIPDGYNGKTRAELNKKDDRKTQLKLKSFQKIKKYLEELE